MRGVIYKCVTINQDNPALPWKFLGFFYNCCCTRAANINALTYLCGNCKSVDAQKNFNGKSSSLDNVRKCPF